MSLEKVITQRGIVRYFTPCPANYHRGSPEVIFETRRKTLEVGKHSTFKQVFLKRRITNGKF
jgi:hypothetical protein